MEFKYDIPQTKASETKCSTISAEVNFKEEDLIDLNTENHGKVKHKVDEIIRDMSACAQSTQTYISNSATFISNIAKYLEDMDVEIARKVNES